MQFKKTPNRGTCTVLNRVSLLYHCHATPRSLFKTLSIHETVRFYVTCVIGGCSFSWFKLGISPTRFKLSMSCIRSRLGTVYRPSLVISLLSLWNEKYWCLKNTVKYHKGNAISFQLFFYFSCFQNFSPPAGLYLFKANSGNTRRSCKICSKLIINDVSQLRHYGH